VLFVGHGTMEVQSRGRLPGNPCSKKWLRMEWGNFNGRVGNREVDFVDCEPG
jgi:hypothetical protein